VIGIPMDAGPLNGMDALLSTVQMPGGIPVASVAIGKAGAKNAAYLAAQMLALSDDDLAARLRAPPGPPATMNLPAAAGPTPRQLASWVALDETLAARLTEPRSRPASWVVPATPAAPPWITGGRATLAVRLTTHPLARALCRSFGFPIVSTSANRAGRPPARSALQVQLRLGDGIDYLLHGRAGPHRRPSEIIDARSGRRLRA